MNSEWRETIMKETMLLSSTYPWSPDWSYMCLIVNRCTVWEILLITFRRYKWLWPICGAYVMLLNIDRFSFGNKVKKAICLNFFRGPGPNSVLLSDAMFHYTDVIMTIMASQITSLTVIYSNVYSDADQRKHQSSTSLAFVWGIHRDRWIPRTKGQLCGNVSIWWRHHVKQQNWRQSDAGLVQSVW